MKASQIWKLERMVYNSFYESGIEAAHKRRDDSDSAVKAFTENIPQVTDPILELLRFQAFLRGWDFTIKFDREEGRKQDADLQE